MHAVVVDPEPSSRGLVRLSLESAGYRVLEAVDAEGGRRLIEEHLESLRLVVTAKVLTAGRGVNVGGEARVESGSKPRMCPACGSARVMPVAYGVASTGMMKDFAAGRVALGGVRESPGSPHWRCRDCDRTWSDAAQGPGDSR